MKMQRKFRLALVLAAVLLLGATAAIAATASTVFQGSVDWNAQPQADEAISVYVTATAQPDAPTDPAEEPPAARTPVPEASASVPVPVSVADVSRILAEEVAKHPGELIVITTPVEARDGVFVSSSLTEDRTLSVESIERLAERLAGSQLPLPTALPEGYAVTSIRITLNCREGGAYTPVATETREGCTVTRYTASPGDDVVTGYIISLADAKGNTLAIRVSMMENASAMDFGLWDEDTAAALTVEGMDAALLITGELNKLHMYRELTEPLTVLSLLNPAGADTVRERTEALRDLHIQLVADGLSGEALLGIFGN